MEHAEVSLIVCSKDKIAHVTNCTQRRRKVVVYILLVLSTQLLEMPAHGSVRVVVQMENDIDPAVFARCEKLGIVLTTFAAVEKKVITYQKKEETTRRLSFFVVFSFSPSVKGSVSSIAPNPACGTDLATILYTSGTTGVPKVSTPTRRRKSRIECSLCV